MTTPPLTIHVAASAEEALPFVAKGYHPAYQQRGMALDSYLTYHGWKRDDPRFVVLGEPTEEATLIIAALAGMLPVDNNPIVPLKRKTYDFEAMARGNMTLRVVLHAANGGPRKVTAEEEPYERHAEGVVIAWRHRQKLARVSGGEGALAAWWKLAVEDWAALLGKTYGDDPVAELMARDREIARARADEMKRREAASC